MRRFTVWDRGLGLRAVVLVWIGDRSLKLLKLEQCIFYFSKCSVISSLGSRPDTFLVAEILGPELGSVWLSGHIPGPGAVYFLSHSAWAPHVNFSRPNSLIIQTHNKRFHLPGKKPERYSGLAFYSIYPLQKNHWIHKTNTSWLK